MNKLTPYIKQIFWIIAGALFFVLLIDFQQTLDVYLKNKNRIEAATNKATCYREVAKLYYSNIIGADESITLDRHCFEITDSIK